MNYQNFQTYQEGRNGILWQDAISCWKGLFSTALLTKQMSTSRSNGPVSEKNRSCCDQVLSLTTHIESVFQNRQKNTVVFIDLTSVYDTVRRIRMVSKFIKILQRISEFLYNILANRNIQFHLNGQVSRSYIVSDEVPQGQCSPRSFLILILPTFQAQHENNSYLQMIYSSLLLKSSLLSR